MAQRTHVAGSLETGSLWGAERVTVNDTPYFLLYILAIREEHSDN